jgi:hypothetical protein
MATRTKIAIFAGLVVAVAGFGLITVAWNGALRQGLIEGQFPYLLSGGVTGLALVIVGLAVVVINQVKAEGDERARQMGELIESVQALAARLGSGRPEHQAYEYDSPYER